MTLQAVSISWKLSIATFLFSSTLYCSKKFRSSRRKCCGRSSVLADDYYFNVKKTIEFGNYGDSHGTVTFTTVDKTNKKIVGKFSGVLYEHGSNPDSVIVKDGQFNTTYE